MLLTLGDLVEDIAVVIDGPINVAADTAAVIERRRGGSAANVAAGAAGAGFAVRFVGQVGNDAIGGALIAEMAEAGVDMSCVRRGGSTGTIVAVVDPSGERSMLTDRRACTALDEPSPDWLDGIDLVHVPFYSFAEQPIATTARTIVTWARERSIAVSVDLSSTTVIDALGAAAVHALVDEIDPDIVLANDDEARAAGVDGATGRAITVIKHGADPTVIHRAGAEPIEIPTSRRFAGIDTTGAGDAFAGGFLTADWRGDAAAAVVAGHHAAARLLASRTDAAL